MATHSLRILRAVCDMSARGIAPAPLGEVAAIIDLPPHLLHRYVEVLVELGFLEYVVPSRACVRPMPRAVEWVRSNLVDLRRE